MNANVVELLLLLGAALGGTAALEAYLVRSDSAHPHVSDDLVRPPRY
ncbi:hypothetical protein QM787_14715 [Rhodococcus ruber]|jgi:hypothetical protein|uniref:Uncharacterized protein n=1 Tax=Rhodococcus ruber TaxID=1830 RepID=A0A098BPB8_9NOCA|nr:MULTISPECIES: hypothetical protein [Rhodococcus]MDO2380873.1 hypothetical protein [Rhodococcus ruber]AXY50128.1 hypothetical protein YT1_0679 [Rhodococcus ruber]MBD8055692.1 hypothetical protein [Rhodococcus ruber]MBP2214624.1 hypothetical protein [Rhodococcus ruber]MCD2127949.1 hypothetical protein [Rhodococcus ruber]